MNEKRIIPCLDIDDGRVVKGVKFADLIDAGDPVEIAKAYELQGADELVLLDIKATSEGRKTLLDVVDKIASSISIPLTVGGGVKSAEDFRQVLESGADKVSIGSACVFTPHVVTECAEAFGSSAVVASIDVKLHDKKLFDEDVYHVYVRGGRENTAIEAVTWSRAVTRLGAGEILLTGMDNDGTKSGYNIDITKKVKNAVNIPVIASGGAGRLRDFYDVFTEGRADAALAASLFHFKEIDIQELKRYLSKKGVCIRKAEE